MIVVNSEINQYIINSNSDIRLAKAKKVNAVSFDKVNTNIGNGNYPNNNSKDNNENEFDSILDEEIEKISSK